MRPTIVFEITEELFHALNELPRDECLRIYRNAQTALAEAISYSFAVAAARDATPDPYAAAHYPLGHKVSLDRSLP